MSRSNRSTASKSKNKKPRQAVDKSAVKKGTDQVKGADAAERLAAMPGFLMCLITAVMLVLDIFAEGMQEKQYQYYQSAFSIVNVVAVVCGIVIIIFKAGMDFRAFVPQSRSKRLAWACFGAFAVCMIISTCVNGLTHDAIHGIPYRDIGIFTMFALIFIYMGSSSLMETERIADGLMLIFLAVSFLVSVAALYDRYVDEIEAFKAKKELSAIFFNGNHFGYFLVMAILAGAGYFIFTKGWRAVFGAVTGVTNLIVLGLNHSLGCMLAVMIVLFVTCLIVLFKEKYLRKRVLILVVILAAAFIAAMTVIPEVREEFETFSKDLINILHNRAKGSAGHNRLKVWRRTVEYIKDRPVVGYGCEGISIDLYSEMAISNPHNEVLTYAAYYGIPAAIFYTLGTISALFSGINARTGKSNIQYKHSASETHKSHVNPVACMAAAGYFISSMTGVAMFYTVPFFFIFLGLTMGEKTSNF